MDEREDACFSSDEDAVLTDIARTFNVKNIKNRLELSAVWDSVTEAYNKATNRSYAKKQLQKRLTNISYKQRKQEEKLRETTESNREVTQQSTTNDSNDTSGSCEGWAFNEKETQPCQSGADLEQQKIRAEMAKEMAELKRAKTEEVRLKKEEILLKVAVANLKEAEKRAELIELEVEEKKRQLLIEHN